MDIPALDLIRTVSGGYSSFFDGAVHIFQRMATEAPAILTVGVMVGLFLAKVIRWIALWCLAGLMLYLLARIYNFPILGFN